MPTATCSAAHDVCLLQCIPPPPLKLASLAEPTCFAHPPRKMTHNDTSNHFVLQVNNIQNTLPDAPVAQRLLSCIAQPACAAMHTSRRASPACPATRVLATPIRTPSIVPKKKPQTSRQLITHENESLKTQKATAYPSLCQRKRHRRRLLQKPPWPHHKSTPAKVQNIHPQARECASATRYS